MKFNINITGEFHNVKGLTIVQEYFINVRCGACNTLYPNDIFISHKDKRCIKIKEKPHELDTFNLAVQCKECKNIMGILIFEPENHFEFKKENDDSMNKILLNPVVNDKCHISTILSNSAIITNVDGLILDVVSNENELFHNCSFDKRTLAEDDNKGKTVDILKFDIEVEQVH